MIIAIKGQNFKTKVRGEMKDITPFVGADSDRHLTQVGIGILFDNKVSHWGLVSPHNLIQCYQAMNKLKDIENIESGTLCHVYESTRSGDLPSYKELESIINKLKYTNINFAEIETKMGSNFFDYSKLANDIKEQQNKETEEFSQLDHLTMLQTAQGNYFEIHRNDIVTIRQDYEYSDVIILNKGDKVKIVSERSDYGYDEYFDVEKNRFIEPKVSEDWFVETAIWKILNSFKGFGAKNKANKKLIEYQGMGYKTKIRKTREYFEVCGLYSINLHRDLFRKHEHKWHPDTGFI